MIVSSLNQMSEVPLLEMQIKLNVNVLSLCTFVRPCCLILDAKHDLECVLFSGHGLSIQILHHH